MADLNNPKGVNFREFDQNRIGIGIHRDQFVEYLNSLPVDQKGWINFDLQRNLKPQEKRGYSHFLRLANIKRIT